MQKIVWILVAFPLGFGCASEHMGGDSDRSERPMGSELSRAEGELERHHEVVMKASDATQVTAETAQHDQRMQWILNDMGDSVSNHRRCSQGATDKMHSMMATLQHAHAEHMSELHGNRSLEALQSACAAYVADMHTVLDDMHHGLAGASCMR